MSEYTRVEYACEFETVELAQKAVKEICSPLRKYFKEEELNLVGTRFLEIQVVGWVDFPTLDRQSCPEWVRCLEVAMETLTNAEGFVESHFLVHGSVGAWDLIYRKNNVPTKLPWEV